MAITFEEREYIREIVKMTIAEMHRLHAPVTPQHEALTVLATQGVHALQAFCKTKAKEKR